MDGLLMVIPVIMFIPAIRSRLPLCD
jgi:hypothetical protein